MSAIIDTAQKSDYLVDPVLVLSNRPDARGLVYAVEAGTAAVAIDHKPYGKDREAFERAMQDALNQHKIEMVVLAGFMRILTPWFVSQWEGRMINIHPSLLPKYPGLHTHKRATFPGILHLQCEENQFV